MKGFTLSRMSFTVADTVINVRGKLRRRKDSKYDFIMKLRARGNLDYQNVFACYASLDDDIEAGS